MSTTASLICKFCNEYSEVDARFIDGMNKSDKINISFKCCSCDDENAYNDITLSELEALINPLSEKARLADFLGISKTKLASYVYPPDVMKEADLDRRKIRFSEVKVYLKSCRQSYPIQEADNWWLVYKMESLKCNVSFNRDTKEYRITEENGIISSFQNSAEFGEYLNNKL